MRNLHDIKKEKQRPTLFPDIENGLAAFQRYWENRYPLIFYIHNNRVHDVYYFMPELGRETLFGFNLILDWAIPNVDGEDSYRPGEDFLDWSLITLRERR